MSYPRLTSTIEYLFDRYMEVKLSGQGEMQRSLMLCLNYGNYLSKIFPVTGSESTTNQWVFFVE